MPGGAAPGARLTRVRSESIGFVFRGFNLVPALTARENVETALVPPGVKAGERCERAAEALTSMGSASGRPATSPASVRVPAALP